MAVKIDVSKSGIIWRYSAYKARIGPFDAMLILPPSMFFFFNISWIAFGIVVIVVMIMYMIEVFMSMPLKIAIKTFRSNIAGKTRLAVPWWKRNHL